MFWKDKQGNKLSFKEFMIRWKQGMKEVTPLQQVVWQIWSTRIILIGLLCGIAISIIGIKTLWWLTIILVGALGNTFVSYLGLWQKKVALEEIDRLTQEVGQGGTKK